MAINTSGAIANQSIKIYQINQNQTQTQTQAKPATPKPTAPAQEESLRVDLSQEAIQMSKQMQKQEQERVEETASEEKIQAQVEQTRTNQPENTRANMALQRIDLLV